MHLRIGTFNLNNLFSRWNFKGELAKDKSGRGWHLERRDGVRERRFQGQVIQPKPDAAVERIAERIKAAAPDILAVEEVEDRDTLREFNDKHLGGAYSECILVEGNDQRGINVGLLSKLPIGQVESAQRLRHPELPHEPVFRRDLLLVEVLNAERTRRLLWVAVTHLKSQFVDWRVKGGAAKKSASRENGRVRRYEAETMARVLRILVGAGEKLVVCGDFNDVPTSKALHPLLGADGKSLGLVNVLAAHQPDPQARWTITHKQSGEDRQFDQYDYLLVPPAMAKKVEKAWVERRKTTPDEPDGSDHDPVFCELAA